MTQAVLAMHAAMCAALGAWSGVQREKVSLGFGPRIVGFTRGGTEYALGCIPLGSSVKFETESYWAAPRSRRIVIPGIVLAVVFGLGIPLAGGLEETVLAVRSFALGTIHPGEGVQELARFGRNVSEDPIGTFGVVLVCMGAFSALPLHGLDGGSILLTVTGAADSEKLSRGREIYAWVSLLVLLTIVGVWIYVAIRALAA